LDASSNYYDWYWYYWWSHRHAAYHSRTIHLKLNKNTNFLNLVEDLNKEFVQSIRVSKTTHSDILKLRKEVKKEAMRAAKEKATYLLESVDEKIGNLVYAEELPEATNNYNPYWYNQNFRSNSLSNSSINASNYGVSENNQVENVGNIKLRYEVKVKFEIL
jgi:uncharacterized protein